MYEYDVKTQIGTAVALTAAAGNPDASHFISLFSLVSVNVLFSFVSSYLSRMVIGVRVCIGPGDSVPIGWSVLCVALIKHSFFIFPSLSTSLSPSHPSL